MRAENRELRRANEILKAASVFFAAELTAEIAPYPVEFIDTHKRRFGVEPVCAQLTELGCAFALSSYYEARSRPPSARRCGMRP